MSHLTAIPDPALWPAWWRHLEMWRGRAGLNKTEWAHALGFDPRVVRRWSTGPRDFQADTLRQLLLGLYQLRRQIGPAPDRPLPPAELLDWLGLTGRHRADVLALLQPNAALPEIVANDCRQMAAWLASETESRLAWNPPALPAACVARAALPELARALTGLSGYRQPEKRVVVLHGSSGSGKTTLAAALIGDPAIQGYFRHGGQFLPEGTARWLAQAGLLSLPAGLGLANSPFSRWWAWLAGETTVGLVVIDDLTDGRVLKALLERAGPQVRFLVTTQERDQILVGASPVRAAQILVAPVGGLSPAEAEAFVSQLWQRPLRESERTEVERLRRQVSRPAALRLLAAEVESGGWDLVWRWLWEHLDAQTPLGRYWATLWQRAWQRRNEAEQQWLAELAGAIEPMSSFGAAYAGLVWQVSAAEAAGRLMVLARCGWLEQVTEPELAELAPKMALWQPPRYRFVREGWSYTRQQRPVGRRSWQRLRWTGRLYQRVGRGLDLSAGKLLRRARQRWAASDEVEAFWQQMHQQDELGEWLRLTWSQHWLRPPAELVRLVKAGQRGSLIFGGLAWGCAWLWVVGGLWLLLGWSGLLSWLPEWGWPAWLSQTAAGWWLFLFGFGGTLLGAVGQTLSYEVPLTLARTVVAAREQAENGQPFGVRH